MREAREKHITLHGVDGEVLAAFIRFLYTCHCSIATEKLVGLCAMADLYDVTLLQQLCMDAIRMHATNHRCGRHTWREASHTAGTAVAVAWGRLYFVLLNPGSCASGAASLCAACGFH